MLISELIESLKLKVELYGNITVKVRKPDMTTSEQVYVGLSYTDELESKVDTSSITIF